jgi:hypothetical protein
MKRTCKVLRHLCISVSIIVGLSLPTADGADAPRVLRFEWRATSTVTRWIQGSDQESTTRRQLSGTGTITIVRDPSPDVRFAFDFAGPDGRGSGVVPRSAEDIVDPNFSFPSPLPPGLPPADALTFRGGFRRTGQERVPSTFTIDYSEIFVCRTTADRCGDIKRWNVTFTGHAGMPGAARSQ